MIKAGDKVKFIGHKNTRCDNFIKDYEYFNNKFLVLDIIEHNNKNRLVKIKSIYNTSQPDENARCWCLLTKEVEKIDNEFDKLLDRIFEE